MRFRGLHAVLIAVALPSPGFAQTAPMPSEDDFRVGDTWVWRRVDNFTGNEIARYRRTISMDGEHPRLVVGGKPYTVLQIFTHASMPVDDSNAWRVWPLSVGRKWNQTVDWTNAYGKSARTRNDVAVVAYESVVVPAGTFMAFRIESRGLWQTTDYANFSGTGPVTDIYWYAPEADADVKTVHRSLPYETYTQELVTYERTAR